MFWLDQQVVTSHPTLAGGATDQGADLWPYGELILDHSGCRMLASGSTPECRWRCPQHCKTNVGAYNTVRALTCPEGIKAPILSYPDGTFLQACRAWSSVLRLT